MKKAIISKIIMVFIVAALINLTQPDVIYAFHLGGVGACNGCHTMHNSEDNPAQGIPNVKLLKGTDGSSTCLNCHAGAGSPNSYQIASPDGSAMSPGGDFYWLTKNFAWSGGYSPGDSHAHNIVAADFGYTPDSRLSLAPGGTYLSINLGCTSCHDPHGNVSGNYSISGSGSYGGSPGLGSVLGNYRLLGGYGYNAGEQTQRYIFTNDAPIARQNPVIQYGETDTSHVDYGSGMSEWCANCHISFLTDEHDKKMGMGFEHPSGNDEHLEGKMVDNYDKYVKTGDLSGNAATSYLTLVPFERGVTDTALLDPTSTQGPDNSSNVMCLTCHRAHASAFRAIGRWDFYVELIADSHPAEGDSGVTGNDVFYSYYGRDMIAEFGVEQKAFCEKCHGKVPQNRF
jgi:hypothetical protein